MRTPYLLASACTASDPEARYHQAELAIWDELTGSLAEYPRIWRSPEEGAMVLAEEVDELWDEIRGNHIGRARAEASQVGAMALRFIADLYEPDGPGGAVERCRAAAAEQHDAMALVGPRGRQCASSHEAFGYLKREFDALWSAIRFDEPARRPCGRDGGAVHRRDHHFLDGCGGVGPMSAAAEMEWQKRAVCYLETSDAPEMWTSDRRPHELLRKELQRMCARCPVRERCAGEAVFSDAETGTYAGVYLPQNIAANAGRRATAMEELRVIAGLPSARDDLAYLGVSA